jgi:hypothetical protein
MRKTALALGTALGLAVVSPLEAVPVTLRGSPESMVRQHSVAKQEGHVFARTPAEIRALEESGALVRLDGDENYEVADFVRDRLALPEMRVFIERLAAQYRAATGEKLVVTSLIRPANRQPGNAHSLSVHPTGMAVDLRVSQRAASRQWLESTLLSLERQGLLDVTRESRPPHYHVALFPTPYLAHVERLQAAEAERMLASAADDAVAMLASVANGLVEAGIAAPAEEAGDSAPRRSALILVLATAVVLGWSFRGRIVRG